MREYIARYRVPSTLVKLNGNETKRSVEKNTIFYYNIRLLDSEIDVTPRRETCRDHLRVSYNLIY